jgi:hypothetical protein
LNADSGDNWTKVQLTGVLLVRRTHLESAVRKRPSAKDCAAACNTVLRDLADSLSAWVTDIARFPELERLSSQELGDYLWTPRVLNRLKYILRRGDREERDHLKKQFKRLLSTKPGPSASEPPVLRDIRIAEMSEEIERRLQQYVRENEWGTETRSAFDRTREALLGIGYPPATITAVLGGRNRRGRGVTLRGAADRLVAFKLKQPNESIAVRAARGRRLLQALMRSSVG